MLAGEKVHWVSEGLTRNYKALLRNTRMSTSVFRRHRVQRVLSTGSNLALAVMPQARLRRIPCVYIESATRLEGPSLTGRLLARVPGINCFTQHERWANETWRYAGNVFDGFETAPSSGQQAPGRLLVSLGTSKVYQFDRLVDQIRRIVPGGVDITWQIGHTRAEELPGKTHRFLSARDLSTEIRESDVVIAHCGTGIALSALQAGKIPILVPRRPEWREHVDDHQSQIAQFLGGRGLALIREVEHLTTEDLNFATRLRATRLTAPSRLSLQPVG
jgi:UDP-N-acetylglucosamine transferase subunit ALG13